MQVSNPPINSLPVVLAEVQDSVEVVGSVELRSGSVVEQNSTSDYRLVADAGASFAVEVVDNSAQSSETGYRQQFRHSGDKHSNQSDLQHQRLIHLLQRLLQTLSALAENIASSGL
jgi:hypothetical protein